MLPGADLQLEIWNWRGGCNGVAPERAEPLNMALHLWIAGEVVQCSADVVSPHLADAPQQIAGVIEHDPGAASLSQQLWNQLGEAPVALGKRFGIVVIPLSLMVKHVLQVGDQRTIRSCRDGWLMHVQRAGKAGTDLVELDVGVLLPHGTFPLHQVLEFTFPPRDRRNGSDGHRFKSEEHRIFQPAL